MRYFIGFAMWLVFCTIATAQTSQEVLSDTNAINAAYRKYTSQEYTQLFQHGFFGNEFEDKVKKHEEHLKQIEAFEANDLPALKTQLSAFESKYGSDRQAIQKQIRSLKQKGISISGDPAYSFEKLKEVTTAPAETRARIAGELITAGSKGGQTHQGYNVMSVEESYSQAKTFLQLAVRYQPDNAEAKRLLNSIDDEKAAKIAADNEAIDAAEFGAHAETFQGPQDVDAIAKVAFEYLSNKESGKDGKLLAVRVAGDWRVADRNLLGETLTWALPVEAAYQQEDDTATARVISMELISRDTERTPPFQRHRLYSSRYVRVANLPQAAGSSSSSLLRLPLSALLIMLGFIAGAPLIEKRIPKLQSFYERVRPLTPILGVITLCVGLLAILTSLFSPLGDVLPQAAAIVVGLMLGLDFLIKRHPILEQSDTEQHSPSNDEQQTTTKDVLHKAGNHARNLAQSAQDLLIKQQERIRKLDALRVPIGLTCMALGLLHLIAGGITLI